MTSEDSVPETSGIDDLVSDALGSEPSPAPEVEAAPAEEASQVEAQPPVAEPEAPQAVASDPSQTPVAQPTPPAKIRVGDREYTPQEIQAWQTTSQQFSHLQSKYLDALERLKQPPVQDQQKPQVQTSPQEQLQALRHKYDPVVQKLADQGLIEKDFAQLFPALTAQMVHRDERLAEAEQRLAQVTQVMQQRQQQEQSQGLVGEITNVINAVSQSGEAFASLKDPNVVREYLKYVWELNPQIGHMRNPEFHARQFIAFNKDQYLQQVQGQRKAQQARLARADATGGTRAPGMNQAQEKSPLDEMVEDFMSSSS